MATLCSTYHQLKYSSLNRSKEKTGEKSHTKELIFREMEVYGKIIPENGPKAEKDKTERATGLDRRTKQEKVGSN